MGFVIFSKRSLRYWLFGHQFAIHIFRIKMFILPKGTNAYGHGITYVLRQ